MWKQVSWLVWHTELQCLQDGLHTWHLLEEWRPRMWDRETLLRSSLGRILTNKDVFRENGRLCGCLGGAVVSKLTAHQEGLSSSPRFFGPLGKFAWACVGFLLFPPTVLKTCTLGDSKSLPGVSVCVSCDELGPCVPASNRRSSLGSHKRYKSIPERTYLFITA